MAPEHPKPKAPWTLRIVADVGLGAVGGVIAVLLIGRASGHGIWVNDFIRASAEVLKALAWPAVALVIGYAQRHRISELLVRLRELQGAKFDPPTITQSTESASPVSELQALTAPAGGEVAHANGSAAAADAPEGHVAGAVNNAAQPNPQPPAPPPALPPELERVRSPFVLRTEEQVTTVMSLPAFQDPKVRTMALTTLAALGLVIATFERIESSIWASQIRLLEFLNTIPEALRDVLKVRFYDAAAAASPSWFLNYSFDQYIGYLARQNLVTVLESGSIRITDVARDYLLWRIQQGKPIKSGG